jgi:type VI secretion system secreted protein VgrG
MAQLTQSTIIINGKKDKPITIFSSFTLSQSIYGHHFFRLTCPAESIDVKTELVFNNSKTWMGKSFSINIASTAKGGSLKFKGVITQIQTERYSGAQGDVVISGYSPTIMMESGPHCKTWEKKAVKNIIEDVLKHFPKNELVSSIAPIYGDTLPYYVQYKETAWRFLNRVCSNFGEWLFYDGQKLQIGKPKGKAQLLVYGKDVRRFSMSLEVLPSSKVVMAHDYKNDQVYNSSPTGTEGRAGLSLLGKAAFIAGQELYNTSPKVWNNAHLTNKEQLDKQVNIHAAMQSGKNEKFSGASDSVGLVLGGKIGISGKNMYNNKMDDYGEYTIISINHYTDGQGNYSNDFEAVPSSVVYPPVSVHPQPHCETQSAYVTDNNDPQHLGRVRVRFHWMKPSEKTPWIRVTSPHGGGDKGMFFIPEIGEEAIICFEGDSAVKPFVNGTVYHGKAKTSFANPGNDIKALRTRSGIEIKLNDKDGSLTLTDPSGNVIFMDGKENISITCKKTFTVTAKDIVMTASNNISVSATENLVQDGKVVGITATEGLTNTGKNVLVNGSADLNLITPKLNMNGDETTLNSKKASLNASGDLTVAGGLVKINS